MTFAEFYNKYWLVEGKQVASWRKVTDDELNFIEAANEQKLPPYIRNIGRGTRPAFIRNPKVKHV